MHEDIVGQAIESANNKTAFDATWEPMPEPPKYDEPKIYNKKHTQRQSADTLLVERRACIPGQSILKPPTAVAQGARIYWPGIQANNRECGAAND